MILFVYVVATIRIKYLENLAGYLFVARLPILDFIMLFILEDNWYVHNL